MSTQDDSGIEFLLQSEEKQQHFRLLELPPELLEILTSPSAPILQLKSSENGSGNDNVVLCTPDKTYQLRQVSTSNSVFITEPVEPREDQSLGPSQPGLQAVAQLQSTLEVLSAAQQSAIPYIVNAVPVYTSTGHQSLSRRTTKAQLFANIPLSGAECESGWRDLACFELDEDRHCVLPSASVKLKVWRTVLDAATAAGIGLTAPFDLGNLRSTFPEESEWPDELLVAVLRSMSSASTVSSDFTLEPVLCAKVMGKALLKELSDASRESVALPWFETRWRDLLPEGWRGNATLGLLEGCYRLSSDGQQISYVEFSAVDAATANGATSANANASLGAKRKWHEKFRATKKT